MKYSTKIEAMEHVSKNPIVASKQIDMIECMYGIGEQVSQNELDGIDLDCHQAAMKKAMSY
jgi:hypothetical protein